MSRINWTIAANAGVLASRSSSNSEAQSNLLLA